MLAGSAPAQRRNDKAFHLIVPGLPDRGAIPRLFTCDGRNTSLPLAWSGEPEGTQSFALIVDDPDARDFSHWLLWDIPASVHALAEGAQAEGIPGANGFGGRGYGGPCPPQGQGAHIYSFRLFALDVPSLNLKEGKNRDALDQAMKKHVLAKTEYRLLYARN
jgi:hypothetical protein